ncbi:MAG: hypothetical protein ACOCZ9_00270 [Spirochaetota bacterium]
MVKEELVKRSPLRILEQSTHGGLVPGSIGVIASRKGVGKTACLVHIATDSLLQGKHVIHVSFSGKTDHIISWYEDIFKEIATWQNLEGAMDVHDELIKRRVIMNFNQEGTDFSQVLQSLRAMISDGGFEADMIVIDGLDIALLETPTMDLLHNFAKELGVSVWFSATVGRDDADPDERGVPAMLQSIVDDLSVVITLTPDQDRYVHLKLIKDHETFPGGRDLHLRLDSSTMLIAADTK